MAPAERSVIIIAPPGPLRDAMTVLIASVLPSSVVYILEDAAVSSGLRAEPPPDIALIDGGLFGATLGEALGRLHAAWPLLRCLVLAEDRCQQALARSSGADRALLKDGRAARLANVIERLVENRA
jgi:DNA-binding NarL/FixJ family response regulator